MSEFPRILLVTYYPPNRMVGSLHQVSQIVQRYPNIVAWFSINPPINNADLPPLAIPYQYGWKLSRPSRGMLGSLRQYLNVTLVGYLIGEQILRFSNKNNAEMIWGDLVMETVVSSRVAARKAKLPLLVTVLDDAPSYLRFIGWPKWIRLLFQAEYSKTLRFSASCGVISDKMSDVYRSTYGINSTVLYWGVKTEECMLPPKLNKDKNFVIGHIGTHYRNSSWTTIVDAIHILNNRFGDGRFKILQIGLAGNMPAIDEFVVTGWLPEDEVAVKLNEIDICLVHYPFDAGFAFLAQTSFPTKISSYIQSQRPILAYGPSDSSIVDFVNRYNCGATCTEEDPQILADKIEALLFHEGNYDFAVSNMAKLVHIYNRQNYFQSFEHLVNQASQRIGM